MREDIFKSLRPYFFISFRARAIFSSRLPILLPSAIQAFIVKPPSYERYVHFLSHRGLESFRYGAWRQKR